tara:strand:- start:3778 stop:5007 length:1230 start_codon:yes stop_codon:yes gene_type:complete
MGGALLQLVSYGKQSEYLLGNPSVSFFKFVHKRHTNFSMESIATNFNEQLDFGNKSSCRIGKNGDLINKMLLQISLPSIENSGEKPISWTNELGHSIIKKVELLIGGEVIDTIDGDWLDIYSEFYLENSKKEGYYEMIKYSNSMDNYTFRNKMKLFIPLPFWFCKNIGNSLPLIALQYHDIVVNVYLRPLSECIYNSYNIPNIPTNIKILDSKLYCNYIFLDTKERKYFAQNDHEYLIIQHQKNINNVINYGNKSLKVELEFNHPVKSIYWTLQNQESQKLNLWNNYALNPEILRINTEIEPLKSIEMKLNGMDRFSEREAEHFRLIEPYNFNKIVPNKFIYTYNFCTNPNIYQPSGTINFSRIDNSTIIFKFNDSNVDKNNKIDIKIFAINYNILRIKNGMGGLVFSD